MRSMRGTPGQTLRDTVLEDSGYAGRDAADADREKQSLRPIQSSARFNLNYIAVRICAFGTLESQF